MCPVYQNILKPDLQIFYHHGACSASAIANTRSSVFTTLLFQHIDQGNYNPGAAATQGVAD